MQLNYKVNPIKDVQVGDAKQKGFVFTPSEISLYIGVKETIQDEDGKDIEVVNIQTDLVQRLKNGIITETQKHKLPVAVLSAFNGFETMLPTVNLAAVNAILMSFNLELDESEAK